MKVNKNLLNARHACCVYLSIFGFLVPVSVVSALSLDMPPELLAQRADLIILGRVIGAKAEELTYIGEYTNGTDTRIEKNEVIFTIFEVELIKTFKRPINKSNITLFSSGGTPTRWTDKL